MEANKTAGRSLILTAQSAETMEPTELLERMFQGDPNSDFYLAAERILIDVHLISRADIAEEMERMYTEWDARRERERYADYMEARGEDEAQERRLAQ